MLPNSNPVIEFTNISSKPVNCRNQSQNDQQQQHLTNSALNQPTNCHYQADSLNALLKQDKSLGASSSQVASTTTTVFTFFPGDKLELICRAPESKPAAKLDWIINGWKNLSTIESSGELLKSHVKHDDSANSITIDSLFSVQNQTFVPSKVNSRESFTSQPGSMSSSPINDRFLAQDNPDQSNELRSNLNSIQMPSNSKLLLDQMAESSASKLSFKIDKSLFKTLAKKPSIQHAKQSPKSNFNEQSVARQNKHYKSINNIYDKQSNNINPSKRNSGWHTQDMGLPPGSYNADMLHVACISRVLHLKMSTHIKIRIISDKVLKDTTTIQTVIPENKQWRAIRLDLDRSNAYGCK